MRPLRAAPFLPRGGAGRTTGAGSTFSIASLPSRGSIRTVSPARNAPWRSISASGSSISFWIVRPSGRAPKLESYPTVAM